MFAVIPGHHSGSLGIIEIIFLVTTVVLIIIMLIYCCVVIRMHFMQRNLPRGQVVVMAPPYPAQTPHAIVYSTTPVTAMPSVEREDDTDAPEAPVYPAAYVVPMNAAGSYPQQILVPAPVALTR
ncbi:unnamed protein product [Cylicocyclus nassatus]|uniref:Uncharacterized protein n=1 Tax=Cylicocyclus nassatus TaxID=53992 RepID=A0AA36MDG6_CYLNA|nr:unnamed protein product [Cylicocyclus nassatus]